MHHIRIIKSSQDECEILSALLRSPYLGSSVEFWGFCPAALNSVPPNSCSVCHNHSLPHLHIIRHLWISYTNSNTSRVKQALSYLLARLWSPSDHRRVLWVRSQQACSETQHRQRTLHPSAPSFRSRQRERERERRERERELEAPGGRERERERESRWPSKETEREREREERESIRCRTILQFKPERERGERALDAAPSFRSSQRERERERERERALDAAPSFRSSQRERERESIRWRTILQVKTERERERERESIRCRTILQVKPERERERGESIRCCTILQVKPERERERERALDAAPSFRSRQREREREREH